MASKIIREALLGAVSKESAKNIVTVSTKDNEAKR